MKIASITLMGILLFSTSALAAPPAKSFSGEIMDAQCAKIGSHSTMTKAASGRKECTLKCVKMGGAYVLYSRSTKTVYQLDDQIKPAAFAGRTVRVTGTLVQASSIIHVTSIKAAS
jgi:Protein of unknown function (DUF5818)